MEIEGAARPGMVTKDGLMICGTDGEDDGAGDGDDEDGGSKQIPQCQGMESN